MLLALDRAEKILSFSMAEKFLSERPMNSHEAGVARASPLGGGGRRRAPDRLDGPQRVGPEANGDPANPPTPLSAFVPMALRRSGR